MNTVSLISFQSRRAAGIFIAAAVLFPLSAFSGAPVAADVQLLLCLSASPEAENWLAGLEEALNKPPRTTPLLVIHRVLPDVDENLLVEFVDSLSPVAVVSRQPLSEGAKRNVTARGLPVFVVPSAPRDAVKLAKMVLRAVASEQDAVDPTQRRGGYLREMARGHLEFGDDGRAERALLKILAEAPEDAESLLSLVSLRRRALRFWSAIDAAERRALKRALRLSPADLETLALLVAIEKTKPARAAVYAGKASDSADAQPLWRRPDAYRFSARLWRELGERDHADALYLRGTEVDPGDLKTLRDLLDLRRERPARTGNAAPAPYRCCVICS